MFLQCKQGRGSHHTNLAINMKMADQSITSKTYLHIRIDSFSKLLGSSEIQNIIEQLENKRECMASISNLRKFVKSARYLKSQSQVMAIHSGRLDQLPV